MILYFTGSGNTKFVADCLAEKLDDEAVSLVEVLRSEEEHPQFASEKPFIICFPIYAWNVPPVIRDLIGRSTFTGSKDVYFVATMGLNSGNTFKTCMKLASAAGLTYKGYRGVVMPDNYVVAYDVKTPEQAAPVIAAGAEATAEIAAIIAAGETLVKTDVTGMAGLKSGLINSGFSKGGSSTKNYYVGDGCTMCGNCVRLCPLNNLSIEDGKVAIGASCTACYACLHHCPTHAFNIKGKTEKHGRYLCPDYAVWKTRA